MIRCSLLLVLALLTGCGGHRLVVTDQVSGRPVEGLTVRIGSGQWQGDGSVGVPLPPDDATLILVQADGYRPWSSTAGNLRGRPSTAILLDPRWRTDFATTPPSAVRTRTPCPCRQPRSR